MPDKSKQPIEDKLALLQKKFRTDLGGKFDTIHNLLAQLAGNQHAEVQLNELHRLVHSLAGSAGTFGMHEVSNQAHEFEIVLKQLTQQAAQFNPEMLTQLQHLFQCMKNSAADSNDSQKAASFEHNTATTKIELPVEPMTILLADDDPVMRDHLQMLLEKQGHKIHLASNGNEAVSMFREIAPSMVILDVVMPELGGYQAAKLIKAINPDKFTPLLFLSALHEDENLMIGIKNGGDDFLTKPVNENLLTMRIYAMQRIQKVYDERERYREQTEEEINTSRHVFRQITQRNQSEVDGITMFTTSAGHFCGDLTLYNMSHDNRLYILHGDFTGHGLSAAIGAIPAADIFYAMSSQGLSISDIARKLNSRLNHILPTGKFLACILCCLDTSCATLEYWCGGMPPILGLNDTGDIFEHASDKVALGILPDTSFNAQSHTVSLSDISKLLLYSDGLLEAWNEKEQMFGQQRLRQAFLECTDSPAPLEFIYSQVERFVCGHAFEDDITMTYIDTHALPGYA